MSVQFAGLTEVIKLFSCSTQLIMKIYSAHELYKMSAILND